MTPATGPRPATLTSLLEAVGDSVLTPVEAPAGLDVPVSEPEILDPARPRADGPHTLLLGIGLLPDAPQIREAVRLAAAARCAGLVVKLHGGDAGELRRLAREHGLAVLAADDRVSWRHLDALLSAVIGTQGRSKTADEVELGDLFALANAAALQVGGAIAIMDTQRRILAYSTVPGQVIDEVRQAGILGRHVPEEFHGPHTDPLVWRSDGPVRIDNPGALPRLAVAVKAGPNVLGSIWAVDEHGDLDARASEALANAARLAALHLLQYRSARDIPRRTREKALRGLLAGTGPAPGDVFGRADAYTVVGFEVAGTEALDGSAVHVAELITDYTRLRHSKATTVQLDHVVYTLLPTGVEEARDLVCAAVERIRSLLGVPVRAGIGGAVEDLGDVPDSRRDADDALQVLAHRTPDTGVADVHEVRAESFFLRLRSRFTADLRPLPALQRMVAHDARHGTEYTATVRAYLECLGDTSRTAERLFIHANTLRYRVQRAGELFGLDLTDPDATLLLWLQLRLR
ncbi:helix-turn-helix domain-containing protein [Glycomyces sp. NPDC047369]